MKPGGTGTIERKLNIPRIRRAAKGFGGKIPSVVPDDAPTRRAEAKPDKQRTENDGGKDDIAFLHGRPPHFSLMRTCIPSEIGPDAPVMT